MFVGIDLGTTHTVVAYSAPAETHVAPAIFPVAQWVSAHERDALSMLPSALYLPIENEQPALGADWIVGSYARARGAEIPARFVHSAKSWLAHSLVDRQSALLPWASDGPKISPIEASTRILRAVVAAWNREFPHTWLENQDVTLTVPASFDEVARKLTLSAAKSAGLSHVRLFEEPQAAFLAFANQCDRAILRDLASENRQILVCDVGGGTSDFSLVEVLADDASPFGFQFRRIAVSDHLLLGGDNLDLALAHAIEPQFTADGRALAAEEFAQLTLACRHGKEQLFSSNADQVRVTLAARGSQIVGGSRSATLSRELLNDLSMGFFPENIDIAAPTARVGLRSLGLPYASDPAISRHVAQFLVRHRDPNRRLALLLNGGMFRASALRERLHRSLQAVFSQPIVMLENPDTDLSVAVGAALYGASRSDFGPKFLGGSAHAAFLAVGEKQAVCVLARGTEPGNVTAIDGRFVATVGQPARFELFSSADGNDSASRVCAVDDAWTKLPPMVTVVGELAKRQKKRELPVRLFAQYSELGTLEIALQTPDERTFALEFDLRAGRSASAPPPSATMQSQSSVDRSTAKIIALFEQKEATRDIKDLPRELEKELGDRKQWSLGTLRRLADALLSVRGHRRKTPENERVWWSLVGYSMRPGFGAPVDNERMKLLSPLWFTGLQFPNESQSQRAWWVAFRRIVGGLAAKEQTEFAAQIMPFFAVDGAKRKSKGNIRPEPFDEMLYFASMLERIPADTKIKLGTLIIERTWTSSDINLWQAIGRIGARVPLYGSLHLVLPAKAISPWIEDALRVQTPNLAGLSHALVQLAQKTDDRVRDIDDRLRDKVLEKLAKWGASEPMLQSVREVRIESEVADERWGDALPAGLRLAQDD